MEGGSNGRILGCLRFLSSLIWQMKHRYNTLNGQISLFGRRHLFVIWCEAEDRQWVGHASWSFSFSCCHLNFTLHLLEFRNSACPFPVPHPGFCLWHERDGHRYQHWYWFCSHLHKGIPGHSFSPQSQLSEVYSSVCQLTDITIGTLPNQPSSTFKLPEILSVDTPEFMRPCSGSRIRPSSKEIEVEPCLSLN